MTTQEPSRVERLLIALPWSFIPLLAIHFVSIWNELPQRIPVHFDLQGNPNRWQSPQTFAVFAFVLLVLLLAVLSFATLQSLRLRSMSLPVILINYLVTGTTFTLLWQTLDHTVYRRAMDDVWPTPAIFPLVAFISALILVMQLQSQTAKPSSTASIIAEEQHRSLLQLLFIVPGLSIGFWLAIRAVGPPRVLGIFLIAIMGWVAIAMLEGFRYLVRTDGVQIKGFMLPLRFIPRSSIHSYRTQPWTGLGYGIRLTSTGTAYIWGGKNVVNIVTNSGDVMLGHDHPEHLIQDLDRMMQTAH
jgi:hypothetical protein